MSQAFYREEVYLDIGYSSLEDYLVAFWEGRRLFADANDFLAMLRTWQNADISAERQVQRRLRQGAGRHHRPKAIVMPGRTDLYFPPEDNEIEVSMMPNAEFRPIESIWGHLAGEAGIQPAGRGVRGRGVARAAGELREPRDAGSAIREISRGPLRNLHHGPSRPAECAGGADAGRSCGRCWLNSAHDPEMRVGIVTGAGRAFSAGADLREMAEGGGSTRASQTEEERIEAYRGNQPFGRNPKPFIAAVNGLAIGAGMERAADCDIRISSTEAYFGLFEVKRGILANYGINHLARLMPFGEAMYLMLTGDTMSAEEARRLGFVHEVLEPDALLPRAVEIAEMIGANAPLAVQGTKAVAQFWRRYGLEESYRLNAAWGQQVLNSEDAREGPRAFAEKRPPEWRGR